MLQKIKFWGIIILALWLVQICNRRSDADYTSKKSKYEKQLCFEGNENAIDFIASQAKSIHDAEIMYNSEPLSDCSGMFLRMIQSIAAKCPDWVFPKKSKVRSSRELAKYYYDEEKLVIIKDASKAGKYLKPGVAVFFGQDGKTYNKFDIQHLTSTGTGIEHVGIIIATEEKDGKVESYQMFHGRSAGKPAAITTQYHTYPRGKYPAYGNWGQELVAIAPILPSSILEEE